MKKKSPLMKMHHSKSINLTNFSKLALAPISERPTVFSTFDTRNTPVFEQFDHYITSEAKMDPYFASTQTSPQPHKSPQSPKGIKKEFFDMIGSSRTYEKPLKSTPLHSMVRAESIALTDFMGNGKYKLFKKLGLSDAYNEIRKSKETRHLIEEKNILTYKNIMHTDRIREFEIRSPTISKNMNLSPLFEKEKYGKFKDKKVERLDKIQLIIEQCNKLYSDCKGLSKSKSVPQHELLGHISQNPRLKKRKLTFTEIKAIRSDLNKLDNDVSPI